MDWKEAKITVNGVPLTVGQSMTMRVALEHFAGYLNEEGLGDDKHGKTMTNGYQARIYEIRRVLYKDPTDS